MCLIVFSFLKFVINYVSYFDIFKCCSVSNHLIFIGQYYLVFLFLSLLFHLYFQLGPRPICLPIFQAQKETYNSRPIPPKSNPQQGPLDPSPNSSSSYSLLVAQLQGQAGPTAAQTPSDSFPAAGLPFLFSSPWSSRYVSSYFTHLQHATTCMNKFTTSSRAPFPCSHFSSAPSRPRLDPMMDQFPRGPLSIDLAALHSHATSERPRRHASGLQFAVFTAASTLHC